LTRPIALLTDFGSRDGYVGIMKGVILNRLPGATLVDLSHDVPPQDIRHGAFVLATSVAYFPRGTVFLAVVDPGVGSQRRAVAVEASHWSFVGPDNGLFAWTLRFLARDGQAGLRVADGRLRFEKGIRAVELTEDRFWLAELSSTFHGRDLFAPVAAELSRGRSLQELGLPIEDLTDLPWPATWRDAQGSVSGEVVFVDTYGNLITNLGLADLPGECRIEIADRIIPGLSGHFQSPDQVVALIGSSGFLEIACPNGNAARLLSVTVRTPVYARAG
jgi:S-adenosylmethionine hydrolase